MSSVRLIATSLLLFSAFCLQPTHVSIPTAHAANLFALQEEMVPPPIPEPLAAESFLVARPVEIPADRISCPPVSYRTMRSCRCLPPPTLKATLLVEDPKRCGCYAKVPICIPACCEGEMKACPKMGILGRRRVIYTWSCGMVVDVLFRTRGDIVVTYDRL